MSTSAPTSIIGRDHELAWLAHHVGPRRIVGVVGLGGIGKTRLVTAHLATQTRAVRVSVRGVDLTTALSRALALGPLADAQALALALAALPPTTIFVDDAEELTSADRKALDRWVAHAPRVGWIAASRLPLENAPNLSLSPLSPDAARVLFAARLPANALAPVVSWERVIDALGGWPLALELAAPWTAMMWPEELSLDLVSDGLDAMLSWAHARLGESERRVLDALAIFSASFTREDVAALVDEPALELMLARFVRASLLLRDRQARGAFELLPPVRAWLRERVCERTRLEERLDVHLLATVPAHASRALRSWPELESFARREPDIRAAIARARTVGDRSRALALTLALEPIAWSAGTLGEWHERLAELGADAPTASLDAGGWRDELALGTMLVSAHAEAGRYDAAEVELQRLRNHPAVACDARRGAWVEGMQALVAHGLGHDASAGYERAISLSERAGDRSMIAQWLVHRTLLALELGRRDDIVAAADRLVHELAHAEPAIADVAAQVVDGAWALLDGDAGAFGASDDIVATTHLARMVKRVVAATRARASRPSYPLLRVGPNGQWFEIGDRRIELGRRPVLRRMMTALIENGGAGLEIPALIAATWPDEKLIPRAARARAHVAISSLRQLGLGDALVTTAAGYALHVRVEPAS